MPVFDSNILHADLDGLSLLASILHPAAQARSDAIRRGQELASSTITAEPTRSVQTANRVRGRVAGKSAA